MKVVITSATVNEWMGINKQVSSLYTDESNRMQVSFHKSGVGLLASTFSLSKLVIDLQPDLILQVGIAGTFDNNISLGKVVAVSNEYLGDVGVEENENFKDIFDLKLENPNEFPFKKKRLANPWLNKYNLLKLPEANSVTVNEVTTQQLRIHQLQKKYKPVIESMEGAALHYVGLQTNTPFIQLRGISNYIGERDKSKWQIQASLENLTTAVLKYLDLLYKLK